MKKNITLVFLVMAIFSSAIAQVPAIPTTAIADSESVSATVYDTIHNTGTAALTSSIGCTASNGTAMTSVSSDSIVSVTYTPSGSYSGVDTFCLIVCNGAACDTVQVPVTVRAITPVVPAIMLLDSENTSQTIYDTIHNTGNSSLISSIGCTPSNGTATTSVGSDSIVSVIYTPATGYSGSDTFCLIVCNGTACDTVIVPVTVTPTAVISASCDTFFNLQSNLDTATLIPVDLGGYVSGNNGYGDIAIAEEFPVTDSGYYLTSATIYFGYVSNDSANYNDLVTIYVWDNTGLGVFGNNAPGNAIDSAQVTMGMIAQSIGENKGLMVHFTSTTALQTDSVFVGVALPINGVDSIAVYTNSSSGPDGNGWVLGLDPSQSGAYTWNSYNDDYQFGGGSLGNYIKVTMCAAPNPNPAANFSLGNSSTCSPDVVTVTDTTSGPPAPNSWTWIFGDGNTANGPTATDVYTSGGYYTITELVSSDAGSVVNVFVGASQSVSLLGSPIPAVTVTPPASDTSLTTGTVTLSGGTGNDFYTWSDGTTGSTDASLVAGGVYAVTVQDQNGCITVDSFSVPYPLGIVTLSGAGQVKVYPNPATDVLTLEWSQKSNAEVSVIDLNGNVVISLETEGETRTICDIHNLATGVYVLRITDLANNRQQSMLFTKL